MKLMSSMAIMSSAIPTNVKGSALRRGRQRTRKPMIDTTANTMSAVTAVWRIWIMMVGSRLMASESGLIDTP